jgi:hypothetical protein
VTMHPLRITPVGRRGAITKVVDDRGVTHAVRQPSNEEARGVLAEVEAQGYVQLSALPAFFVVLAVLSGILLISDLVRGGPNWTMIRLVFCVLCFLVTAWLSRHMVAARVGRRSRRAILNVGRCPVCCYPRAGLERQADGAMACPECGAAWRRAVV